MSGIVVSLAKKGIIRPSREKYKLKNMPHKFTIDGFGEITREDVSFQNLRGQAIVGSYYAAPSPIKGNPCVVYMHGNASNQLEGRFCVSLFLPIGISVFCFDFSGCGCSGGDYVTLGHYESQDAILAVQAIQDLYGCEKIAFWGRAMGAVTAFIIASTRKDIKAIVADTPFSSLAELCMRIAHEKKVPDGMYDKLWPKIREEILSETGFDVETLNIIDLASYCTTPTFFIHGSDDEFIPPSNSQILYDSLPTKEKEIHIVPGSTNDDRPQQLIKDATVFLAHWLGIDVEFD